VPLVASVAKQCAACGAIVQDDRDSVWGLRRTFVAYHTVQQSSHH
jgi:hypothetical protein